MFKSYLKIAFRNLVKHKRYSLINILGLAIGLACFVLIMLWVQDELSYDQFHQNADNIYIVFRQDKDKIIGATAQPLATALKTDLGEVTEATSIAMLPETFNPYIQYENKWFDESVSLTDARFFNIFSFNFIEGDPNTAFENPHSIILTERLCKKYFGNKKAFGESLSLTFLGQKKLFKVSGILENLPHNSHFQREIFIPIDFTKSFGINLDNWSNQVPQTFIMTKEKINISDLEQKIRDCKEKYFHEEKVSYVVLPLTKIHLYTNDVQFFSSTGDIRYIYIFSVIAGIILLIACINYMNLSNALSLKRTKEIGIKRVVGARRIDLIGQYFSETLILTVVALFCALLIVELFLPVLNQLIDKSLVINYFSGQFLIAMCSTVLITTIISGFYPAFFITKFQPVQVLKQKILSRTNGLSLQKGLVIFQFALSTLIIICTVIVYNQLRFIKNTNLGYDKENVICLKVRGNISNTYNTFKNKILTNSDIFSVSQSQPWATHSLGRTGSINWPEKKEQFQIWILHVDADFAATYKIEMHEGRFYSNEYTTDRTSVFVLNQAAINEMGIKSPLGKEITVWGHPGRIIGIAKDFHFNSLHHVIEPLILRIPEENEQNAFYKELSIRIKPNAIQRSLVFLKENWKLYFPDEPFDYYFFDEQLNASYLAEQRMGDLFSYFSLLAIFVACLGLYGLTAFMIERKIKDIGLHKVLGASIATIVFLLSKRYLWWIVFANLIAWPLALYVMNEWLQNFAYRIDLTIWPFFLSGVLALLIAVSTVSWQVFRAATANPVESLRYE